MSGPRMVITGPVLDAADPVGLARFYERLLGWNMVECEGPRPGYPSEDGWAKLRSPAGDIHTGPSVVDETNVEQAAEGVRRGIR